MPDHQAGIASPAAQYLRGLSLLDASLIVITLSAAVWLKLVFAASSPEGLAWILSPTMQLVRAFTGLPFHFDPVKGYVNFDTTAVVGTSCAGVNYLVIALCMTVCAFVPRFRRHKLAAFAGLVLGAYAVTVMVNSFRIIGGIALLRAAGRYPFVLTDALHEAEGIFVYFSFLVLYYASLRALIGGRRPRGEGAPKPSPRDAGSGGTG